MIKITFDGNDKDGYSILAEIPYDILVHKPENPGKGLFIDDSPEGLKLGDLLLWTRNQVFATEGVNILEHELVVIHTDSSYEPGPFEEEHLKLIEEELKLPEPPINTDPYPSNQGFKTSEEMLEAIAQGKIDPSTLPQSFPEEGPIEAVHPIMEGVILNQVLSTDKVTVYHVENVGKAIELLESSLLDDKLKNSEDVIFDDNSKTVIKKDDELHGSQG